MAQHTMFMVLILVVGVLLIWINVMIDNSIKAGCGSNQLISANKGIQVIGTVSVVAALSYFVCIGRCNCGDVKAMAGLDYVYTGFFLLLGITITVLGFVILNESSKPGCDGAKTYIQMIWPLGALLTLIGGGYIAMKLYKFNPDKLSYRM